MRSTKQTEKVAAGKRKQQPKPKHSARTKHRTKPCSVVDLSDAPIDVPEQLRTTALCINRILTEPGITRIILSFYKDGLTHDVLRRMAEITQDLIAMKRATRRASSLVNEMVSYTENDSIGSDLFDDVCLFLLHAVECDPVLGQVVAEYALLDLLDILSKGAESTGDWIFQLLREVISPAANDIMALLNDDDDYGLERVSFSWKNHVVDHLLDKGSSLTDVLVRRMNDDDSMPRDVVVASSIIGFIVWNVHFRPTSRHCGGTLHACLERAFTRHVLGN
jgi:hypothetical protein